MELWHAFVLGIIQGVTEFLPISSSGHLVIAQQWLGITQEMLAFDAIIHFGSLFAVVFVYRRELLGIVRGIISPGAGGEAAEGRKLLFWLILATLPVLVIGLTLRDAIAGAFSSVYITSFMLFVTGGLLWFAEKRQRTTNTRAVGQVPTVKDALWMGLAQAAALLPGLSRSGTTISAGMMVGMNRESAARISFLMAIPTLAGATLLEMRTLISRPDLQATLEPTIVIVGTLTAAVSSYAAIALLLRFLQRGRLLPFAYYTWFLGAVTLALTLR